MKAAPIDTIRRAAYLELLGELEAVEVERRSGGR